jgi:hypothetical protein
MQILRLPTLALMLVLRCAATPIASDGYDGPDQASFQEALKWVRSQPRIHTEYDYVMTVRLRFLFFWVKRDDVGGGYIKLGDVAEDPRLQVIQVLFGSDPAKAPRSINRWGAGTEIARRISSSDLDPASSVFFGFIKPSQGGSVSSMQRELYTEGQKGQHLFEATLSLVDHGRALSTLVPFYTDHDFNLHELEQAQQIAMRQLEDGPDRKFSRLEGPSQLGCERAGGFLSTIGELLDDAVQGARTPATLCYLYDAHQYTATLESAHRVAERTVRIARREGGPAIDQTYRDLRQAHFRILRQDTGGETDFDILVGASGPLRGVPVQISYNPNWWFQVVLNLKAAPLPSESSPNRAGPAVSRK